MSKVLLADDHPFLRSGVELALSRSPYWIVHSASDGADALEGFAAHEPDILVLDLQMPPPGGLDVVARLRADGRRQPVLLLTAEIDDRQLARAKELEVEGILLKQSAGTDLVRALDTIAAGEKFYDPPIADRIATLDGSCDPLSPLAARERELAELVAQGMRNRDIAQRLSLTEATVKFYLHQIYQKLGIESRTELAFLVLGRN